MVFLAKNALKLANFIKYQNYKNLKKKFKKFRKINRNDVFALVERIIDHKIFRPVAIAILVSFSLFNGVLYVKGKISDYQEHELAKKLETPLKIRISEGGKVLDFNQVQIVERRVKSGDTILNFLTDLEVSQKDVIDVLASLRKVYGSGITVGNSMIARYKVKINYDKDSKNIEENQRSVLLSEFELIISPELQYVVTRQENGEYKAKEIKQVLTKKVAKYSGVIKNGLFLDAVEAGASPNAVMNMINLYAYDVDFARDIKEGDKFEIIVDSYFTESGRKVRDGTVLFASLETKGRKIEMYAHRINKSLEYFDEKGNSVRKSLLKTPINGARVSSGFGMRRHPVLGYSKLHKGVDFAAASGTPILAAGDGVIVYMAKYGGYGNFVKIRHNAEFQTAYAHCSRFSSRFRNGSKVKQGDVIAYVGSTGRSTGPHLHFEVIQKGNAINPAKVKAVSGLRLGGAELQRFKAAKAEIDKYRKKL